MHKDERVTDAMVDAARLAIVLGEDARGNPVHLSPEEARIVLTAALASAEEEKAVKPAPCAHVVGWKPFATAPKNGAPFEALTDKEEIVPGVWFDGQDFVVSQVYATSGEFVSWRTTQNA